MDSHFQGRTVIITGASAGVGAATARRFAAAGANLVLAARNKKNLDALAVELGSRTRVVVVAMDVTDAAACSNLLRKAEYEFDAIHCLVNNAGFHARGPLEDQSVEDLARMIDVNLRAPVVMTRQVVPSMRRAGGGVIVNVASLAGRTPVPNAATYSASKFGLRAFTFALGEELRGSGIRLAVVSPGPVTTSAMMDSIDRVTDITLSQPISSADDVARVVMSLAANGKRERSMPPISGLLTTLSYLFPSFARALQPLLVRRGRRVKRQLRQQMRATTVNQEQTHGEPDND